MSIHEANIAIERATSLVTLLIERNDDTEGKDIDNTLFDINRNLFDATEYLNGPVKKLCKQKKTPDISNDLFDADLVASKMGGLIDIANQHFFTDKDENDPHYLMFAVLYDYADEMNAIIKKIKEKIE